jgi:hypothetical protein
MFKECIFKFDRPFCDCETLSYGYGLIAINNAPAFTFQCRTCQTSISMPLDKLNGGFEFEHDLAPTSQRSPVVTGHTEEVVPTAGPDLSSLVEKDNVIYGPWEGTISEEE